MKRPPSWQVTDSPQQVASTYGLWDTAGYLAFPVRPTRGAETATVGWYAGRSESDNTTISHAGVIVWPDAPQLHASTAPVNLGHTGVGEGYAISSGDVRAYEGNELAQLTYQVVSTNVFTRSLDARPGDSYTVLPFVKGTGTRGSYKVIVARTVDWNTLGLRDLRRACGG